MTGLLFVVGFAFIVGFVLIFVTSLSHKKQRFDGIGTIAENQLPSFERFVRICQDLVEALKLEIDEVETNPEEQSMDI